MELEELYLIFDGLVHQREDSEYGIGDASEHFIHVLSGSSLLQLPTSFGRLRFILR